MYSNVYEECYTKGYTRHGFMLRLRLTHGLKGILAHGVILRLRLTHGLKGIQGMELC